MDPKDCFLELGDLPGGTKVLIDPIRLHKKSEWFSHLGFDVLLLSNDHIPSIPTLCAINKIAPIDRIVVLSMPASSVYNWHIDDHRSSTVNLLVNNHDCSNCFFGDPIDSNRHNLLELQYQPNKFYLFNTKKEHMVINRGERRYMVSLQFRTKLTFENIRDAWMDVASIDTPSTIAN